DVLERVGAVVGDIAVAIRVMALFTVATGVVVMAGALTATRYQRLYESVVLRTLGATRGAVARAFAVEYGCLGAAAGLGGTALAAALAWIVLHFVLDTPWRWQPLALVAGVLASVVLAVAVGFLATWRLRGVDVDGEVRDRRGAWGVGPSLYIRDLDGYQIELKPRR